MSNKDEVKKELGTYSKLEALSKSEGGKYLIKALRKDIITAIDSLGSSYLDAPEANLRAQCARLKERIELLRTLYRAPKNKKFMVTVLDEILKDDPEEE